MRTNKVCVAHYLIVMVTIYPVQCSMRKIEITPFTEQKNTLVLQKIIHIVHYKMLIDYDI